MTPPAPNSEADNLQPSQAGQPRSVFVYGTLMPGERYEAVAQAAGAPMSQERAFLDGYVLYDLHPEGYPALVAAAGGSAAESGSSRVRGWLLHYHPAQWPAALAHLDDLEGLHLIPPLYHRTLALARTLTRARTEADEPKRVWVYLYARPERLEQAGGVRVPSGDWTDVPERRGAAAWPGSEDLPLT